MLPRLAAILGALAALVSSAQLPLSQHVPGLDADTEVDKPWDAPPDTDETGHLIFDSVANLLKHWSNTYHRNGHTVVPCFVTPGTLLFHGRGDATSPTVPEWLSLDAEHSLLFANRGNAGHLFTYAATRPLKLLYFDGASAYNLRSGTLDTQDVVVQGNVSVPEAGRWNPFSRIYDLCDWGKEFGIDGFLRMEFDFEIMYCNFTNGMSVVSAVNVAPVTWQVGPTELQLDQHHLPLLPPTDAPSPSRLQFATATATTTTAPPRRRPGGPGGPGRGPQPPPTPPEGWQGSLRSASQAIFEALHAGYWHNFAPLTGIELDYAGLLTFYNPKYESLVRARREVEDPAQYRLLNISNEDGAAFKRELAEVLTRGREQGAGSGVNWGNVMRHIQERYADRLEFLRHLLREQGANDTYSTQGAEGEQAGVAMVNLTKIVVEARQQVLTMLAPYMSRASVPPNTTLSGGEEGDRTWLGPVMQLCAGSYTKHLDTARFTQQEWVLMRATEGTACEICRTLGLIWTTAFGAEQVDDADVQRQLLRSWLGEVERLMAWLDWAVWLKCTPQCGEDEICSQPQWPFDGVRTGVEGPEPHCISRVAWERTGRGPGEPGGPGGPPGGPGDGGPPPMMF